MIIISLSHSTVTFIPSHKISKESACMSLAPTSIAKNILANSPNPRLKSHQTFILNNRFLCFVQEVYIKGHFWPSRVAQLGSKSLDWQHSTPTPAQSIPSASYWSDVRDRHNTEIPTLSPKFSFFLISWKMFTLASSWWIHTIIYSLLTTWRLVW